MSGPVLLRMLKSKEEQMDEPIAQQPRFEEDYYEDSVDMNMKAYAMTEDEWTEMEIYKSDSDDRTP